MATRTPKSNKMSIKTTLDVHHTFGYISLLSLQDYDVKNSKLHVLWRTQDDDFLSVFKLE